MFSYLLRRMLLLPVTLFFIVLVNFVIINLAPGDPVTVTEISSEGGASRKADRSLAFGSDERYLQFRERYGLTLPILFNSWPWISQIEVDEDLERLVTKRVDKETSIELSVKDYDALRISFGDRSRFIMPKLLHVIEDDKMPLKERSMASHFFARGGTRQAILGSRLTADEKAINRKIAEDNNLLRSLVISDSDDSAIAAKKAQGFAAWYHEHAKGYGYEPNFKERIGIFFLETRFCRYFSRILTLDFGTMRNDSNKTVISEVTGRFKYSLTLALLPMVFTFVVCLFFGFLMAYHQGSFLDFIPNIFFLILYALPIFVVAPFLIEKVALNHHFPFTGIPFPLSGFTSPENVYQHLNSYERLFDVATHIFLPLVAIMYGSLAVQSRLARTAVLEVLRQDYVRTAKAKGLGVSAILIKHVGRNAAITIVTSLASSLGVVLGGSLIVETLFEINGFGKFFYDAILNHDYNVIMFSSLAGSFLSLLGYLAADIAYMFLDPRLTLE